MKKLIALFGAIFFLFIFTTLVSAEKCSLTTEAKTYAVEHNLGLPTHEAGCRLLNYRAANLDKYCDVVLPATKFREELIYEGVGVWGRNSLTGKKDICFAPGRSNNKPKENSEPQPVIITPPEPQPVCKVEVLTDCVKQKKELVCYKWGKHHICKDWDWVWTCTKEQNYEQEMCEGENWVFDCSCWKNDGPLKRERTCELVLEKKEDE